MQVTLFAALRANFTAGRRSAISKTMIEMTTRSSINVKPCRRWKRVHPARTKMNALRRRSIAAIRWILAIDHHIVHYLIKHIPG